MDTTATTTGPMTTHAATPHAAPRAPQNATPRTAPVATTRPRTPRPCSAPRGPAGTGPRGSAGTRPGAAAAVRTAPRALATHAHFAERLLLVLSGRRPVHWMLGQTVGEAYEQLVQLAPTTPFGGHGIRPVVRSCYAQPAPGALEAFACIATATGVRAMAFRLELGADRRWRCAAVELDGLHARVPAQARP
ncbi:Rv3235 family protein [Streptomyces sp. P9(2023)]|uniref:Rv3235 family protein n=1 Tax=Streptomyces sp. P9(2023) TaxID=3064394 RepID=UPI0028F40DD0|nr:Rv3235 family protein [Streptomyces sp. P9(2023)]